MTQKAEPKKRYSLAMARPIAEGLAAALEPYCQRIEIAGSIRRKAARVGDIELVLVPEVEERTDMLGEVIGRDDKTVAKLNELLDAGVLEKRGGYGELNKMLRHVESGIPVDVFSTSAENWGMALVVRTGPAEFNKRMMQRFIELGHRGHAYGHADYEIRGRKVRKPSSVTLNAFTPRVMEVMCPAEEDVFRLLEWPYLEPEARS